MVKKETRCNITRFVYNTFSRELSASHEYLTTKTVGLSFHSQGEDSVCFEFLMTSNQFTHTRLLGVLTPNLGRNHSLSSPNFGTACINPAKNLEQQLWQRRSVSAQAIFHVNVSRLYPCSEESVVFQFMLTVFFLAQALLPFGKQNIKGVTGKNSNTVFVTECDSNVVKRRGQRWEEC